MGGPRMPPLWGGCAARLSVQGLTPVKASRRDGPDPGVPEGEEPMNGHPAHPNPCGDSPMTYDPQTPIGDIALKTPESMRLFETLGLDDCCGGQLPLGAACQKAKRDAQ